MEGLIPEPAFKMTSLGALVRSFRSTKRCSITSVKLIGEDHLATGQVVWSLLRLGIILPELMQR